MRRPLRLSLWPSAAGQEARAVRHCGQASNFDRKTLTHSHLTLNDVRQSDVNSVDQLGTSGAL